MRDRWGYFDSQKPIARAGEVVLNEANEMPKVPGYREVIKWKGRTWTPMQMHHEVELILSTSRIARQKNFDIRELSLFLAKWLEGYVKEPEE